MDGLGSTNANARKPKSCLGQVFNFKSGCFVIHTIAWFTQAQLSLELKTRPRCCPVSLGLSMEGLTKLLFLNLCWFKVLVYFIYKWKTFKVEIFTRNGTFINTLLGYERVFKPLEFFQNIWNIFTKCLIFYLWWLNAWMCTWSTKEKL